MIHLRLSLQLALDRVRPSAYLEVVEFARAPLSRGWTRARERNYAPP